MRPGPGKRGLSHCLPEKLPDIRKFSLTYSRYRDIIGARKGVTHMQYNMLNIGSTWQRLLSPTEAAEIWKLEESTIRKAIAQGRLIDGQDCRKFGKQWVISIDGMARVFNRSAMSCDYSPWSEYLTALRKQEREAREMSR